MGTACYGVVASWRASAPASWSSPMRPAGERTAPTAEAGALVELARGPLTASWPVIASTTKSVSAGCIARFTRRSSSSMVLACRYGGGLPPCPRWPTSPRARGALQPALAATFGASSGPASTPDRQASCPSCLPKPIPAGSIAAATAQVGRDPKQKPAGPAAQQVQRELGGLLVVLPEPCRPTSMIADGGDGCRLDSSLAPASGAPPSGRGRA